MNPLKCTFSVTSGNFLGFRVQHKGIKIDQVKIKENSDMPPSKNLKELQGVQRRLAYTRRFMLDLTSHRHLFRHLMKKGASFKWDDSCQKDFDSIKMYLLSPPVFGAPILRNFSHITAQHSTGTFIWSIMCPKDC